MNARVQHEWPAGHRERARVAVRRAIAYLRDRQSDNGGFCFYHWLGIDEPNLSDTWHAVAALTLVGAAVPDAEATAASLAAYTVTSPEALYQYAFTLDRLGFAMDIAPGVLRRIRGLEPTMALQGTMPLAARLEAILRILCLQRRFDAPPTDTGAVADYVRQQCRTGGWGEKPNLLDTSLAVAILDQLCAPATSVATLDFVDGLQVASFGFTATPDSLFANLDVVYTGFAACALLRLPARRADDAVDYLFACQSGNGGFARTPDALPDIAHTHRALRALGVAGVAETTSVALPPVSAAL